MIFAAIVNLVYNVFLWILSLLPNMSAQDTANVATIHSAIANVRAVMQWVNFWFPIDTLYQILALIILVEVTGFLTRVTRWIASIITANLIK